jgi:hypothetical protein
MRGSLKVLKQRHTFPEAVERGVDFRPPAVRNDRNLFTAYAQASDRLAVIGAGLQAVCGRYLDFQIVPPTIHAFDAATAALPYVETLDVMQYRLRQAIAALAAALNVPQLGRVDWPDEESCRFTYFEVAKDRGLLHNRFRRIAHQHDVVKARLHKLPADEVTMPKRARHILNAIPGPLRPYTRVITGLEVRNEIREESRRNESTWLGQAIQVGARQVRQAATAAGTGLAAAGRSLGTGLASALSAIAAPLAIADPAIVIGEVCLYGWEN